MWRCFIGSMIFNLLLAQEIQLYKFRQDCSTKCESGLVTSSDSCYFTSLITFNESVPRHTLVYFEILELRVPNIFSLDIPSECKGFKENADYYCSQMDKNIFNVTIIVKALPNFSDAKLRGYIRNSNGNKIYSNIQKIPKVNEPTVAKGMLKINGKSIVNESNCHTSFDGDDLTLEFQCVSPAELCVFDILLNDSVVVSGSRKYAEYKFKYTSGFEMLVIVKYSACNLKEDHNIIKCEVKREITGSLLDKSVLAYAALTTIAFLIAIVAVVVVVYRKRGRKKCKTRDEVENKHLCVCCDTISIDTMEDNKGSPTYDNLDDEMIDLISEIRVRAERLECNEMYDEKIKGHQGYQILLLAIEKKDVPVAKHLLMDGNLFMNDLEKFERVSKAVVMANEPKITESLISAELLYAKK